MLIFDFFAGTGSSTKAFAEAGHTVISFELDPSFSATENVDVTTLTAEYLIATYGVPDFVWASPPCTTFSVASMGHHWISGGDDPQPRTAEAVNGQRVVQHTLDLIRDLNPKYGWIVENPRGMLRKLPMMKPYPRNTISYCQYGDDRMKPTDLWGGVQGWFPKPMCKPKSDCHVAAPRGSRTGTQGLKHSKQRSMIPRELGAELLAAIEKLIP